MMASNDQPRITHHAIVKIGTEFLDRASPTKQDWRVFASYLGFSDSWIQSTESQCLPTGHSPTANVLRAWQEWFPVFESLPVERLIGCLRQMNRIDAASCVEQMMKDGDFLDPESLPHSRTHSSINGCVPRSNHTCFYTHQPGRHTSQTNDCAGRSKQSAQEDSYHGYSNSFNSQGHPEKCIYCEKRRRSPTCPCDHQLLRPPTYYQPHQPRNGQSVVSLSSVSSDKSENLPMSSQRNHTMTWPLRGKGDDTNSPIPISNRREPSFLPEPNYHQLLPDEDSSESRPFHSLVSTTSEDRRYHGEDHAGHHAGHRRGSQGTVDPMMIENPTRASPNQTVTGASVLITYAYANFKTAHRLANLLMSRNHDVAVDTNKQIEDPRYPTFTSVTYVIIIYTREYVKEATGIVKSRLNTRFIFDLMTEEFNREGNRNRRFIPIFDHDRIDHNSIPPFLRNYPNQPTRYICNILENTQNRPTHGEISIQRKVYVK